MNTPGSVKNSGMASSGVHSNSRAILQQHMVVT